MNSNTVDFIIRCNQFQTEVNSDQDGTLIFILIYSRSYRSFNQFRLIQFEVLPNYLSFLEVYITSFYSILIM